MRPFNGASLNPMLPINFPNLLRPEFASGFTGGYSYSSPSDLCLLKTQNGFNLNNRGLRRELSRTLSRTVLTHGK